MVETRLKVPTGYLPVGPAHSNTIIPLRLHLRQNNPDGLTDALLDVSNPTSDRYGQHLTKFEVCARNLLLYEKLYQL